VKPGNSLCCCFSLSYASLSYVVASSLLLCIRSLFFSLSVSLSVCFSLLISLSAFLYVCFSLCYSLCLLLSLPLCLCLSLFASLSTSLSTSLCLCFSLCFSQSLFVCFFLISNFCIIAYIIDSYRYRYSQIANTIFACSFTLSYSCSYTY